MMKMCYILCNHFEYLIICILQNFMNNMFSHLDNAKLTAAAIIMCIAMIIIVGILFIAENRLGRDTEE